MHYWHILVAATFWLAFLKPAMAVDYAVGMSLSLDYGVSSIYYPNGSYVGVAKIEGSPAYKAIMRAQPWGNATDRYDAAQHSPLPQQASLNFNVDSLRGYLPRWLGGNKTDSRVATLSHMLKGLKGATESYLESKIDYVSIATPLQSNKDFADVLSAATKRVSLRQENAGHLEACNWAYQANQELDYFCDEPPRLLLSMDYSRAALTADLMEDDCGIPEKLGTLHDRTLGTDSWSDESWRKMVLDLRQLISDGRAKSSLGSEAPISKIVLLGESATDPRLKNILTEVLRDKDSLQASIPCGTADNPYPHDRNPPIDPLFASAVGVATRSLSRVNDEERGHLCQVPVDPRFLSPTERERWAEHPELSKILRDSDERARARFSGA